MTETMKLPDRSPFRVDGLLAKVATTLGVVGSGEGIGPKDLNNCLLLLCTGPV